MMAPIVKLSEKTLLPLSLVISIGTGVYWAGGLERRVEAHNEQITEVKVEVKSDQSERNKFYQEVLQRLTAIESKLEARHNR